MVTTIKGEELKDVLMEPKAQTIKQPIFTIRSTTTQETIIVLEAGTNGSEFNKIVGFFHRFPGVLIYRCLYGQGLALIQKNDDDGEAKELRVASLRPGVEIEIPSGYGHTVINTGKNFLVVVDNAPENGQYIDVGAMKHKHGLVYYVVDKKGEIAFERNTNYSFHPQITAY